MEYITPSLILLTMTTNLDEIFNEALSIIKTRQAVVLDCLRLELGSEVSEVLHLEICDADADSVASASEFEIIIRSLVAFSNCKTHNLNFNYEPSIKVFARTHLGLVVGLLLDSFSKPILIADIATKLFKY